MGDMLWPSIADVWQVNLAMQHLAAAAGEVRLNIRKPRAIISTRMFKESCTVRETWAPAGFLRTTRSQLSVNAKIAIYSVLWKMLRVRHPSSPAAARAVGAD